MDYIDVPKKCDVKHTPMIFVLFTSIYKFEVFMYILKLLNFGSIDFQ